MRRGFTLIEVLISIVVMTIAFFAVLAVQGSALTGYGASRDGTEAIDMANGLINIVHAESQGWRRAGDIAALPDYWVTGSPFSSPSLLRVLQPAPIAAGATAAWAWLILSPNPIDGRAVSAAEVPGRRFCVFGRAEYVPVDIGNLNIVTAGAFAESPIIRVQFAVVYTGRNGTMTACDNALVTALNAVDTAGGNTESLELLGLRVVYAATVLTRREGI